MFDISDQEKKYLLNLARVKIARMLGQVNDPVSSLGIVRLDDKLNNMGAFVTLKINNNLRGCIGQMKSDLGIEELVQSMAKSAARNDPRFKPISIEEFADLKIEISVISEKKRIFSIADFDLKRNGIYIKRGSLSGTFLPQVAKDTGWDKEELLGRCSRDKVGIGWDGWRDAELYTYEVVVFNEDEVR